MHLEQFLQRGRWCMMLLGIHMLLETRYFTSTNNNLYPYLLIPPFLIPHQLYPLIKASSKTSPKPSIHLKRTWPLGVETMTYGVRQTEVANRYKKAKRVAKTWKVQRIGIFNTKVISISPDEDAKYKKISHIHQLTNKTCSLEAWFSTYLTQPKLAYLRCCRKNLFNYWASLLEANKWS